MGLPGAGKTTLAGAIVDQMQAAGKTVLWLNADEVRAQFNDWDFTLAGRLRQSQRMAKLASEFAGDFVVCDFVAPLAEMRYNFNADWIIWVDTIEEGRHEDTNKLFDSPTEYDFRINVQDADTMSKIVAASIIAGKRKPVFNWQRPTVQMLGRWQPWHTGHRTLFERLIERTGQVVIQIRDCEGWNGSNLFNKIEVMAHIKRDLDPMYQGQYEVMIVPNIVHIGWGRNVGYTSGEETFNTSVTSVSGTAIRKEMGLG